MKVKHGKAIEQQCAQCGDTDKKNRKSQSEFLCLKCGHTDNADNNATKVIKQRTFEYLRSKAFLNGKTKRKKETGNVNQ